MKENNYIHENGIKRDSWTVDVNSKVAIKTCDKTFFDRNSTGLPKKDVCAFFGIDYSFRHKKINLYFQEKKYKGYISVKNDSSNRSILAWYKDLASIFLQYNSNEMAIFF